MPGPWGNGSDEAVEFSEKIAYTLRQTRTGGVPASTWSIAGACSTSVNLIVRFRLFRGSHFRAGRTATRRQDVGPSGFKNGTPPISRGAVDHLVGSAPPPTRRSKCQGPVACSFGLDEMQKRQLQRLHKGPGAMQCRHLPNLRGCDARNKRQLSSHKRDMSTKGSDPPSRAVAGTMVPCRNPTHVSVTGRVR